MSAVPIATEPAVGQPADDVLSINVSDAFAGSHATSSCGVYGSAAISCSAANDLPAANAGKQNVACLRALVCVRACVGGFLRACTFSGDWIPLFYMRSVVSLVGRRPNKRNLIGGNTLFPICILPLFQNESACETIHLKMCPHFMVIFVHIRLIFIRDVMHED